MARSAIDDRRLGDELAIVDEDGPHVDEDEEHDVGEFLEGKYEWKDVIWD